MWIPVLPSLLPFQQLVLNLFIPYMVWVWAPDKHCSENTNRHQVHFLLLPSCLCQAFCSQVCQLKHSFHQCLLLPGPLSETYLIEGPFDLTHTCTEVLVTGWRSLQPNYPSSASQGQALQADTPVCGFRQHHRVGQPLHIQCSVCASNTYI